MRYFVVSGACGMYSSSRVDFYVYTSDGRAAAPCLLHHLRGLNKHTTLTEAMLQCAPVVGLHRHTSMRTARWVAPVLSYRYMESLKNVLYECPQLAFSRMVESSVDIMTLLIGMDLRGYSSRELYHIRAGDIFE